MAGSITASTIRVTALDVDGKVLGGEHASLVSNGFIQVQVSPGYAAGRTVLFQDINDDVVVNEIESPQIVDVKLSFQLAGIDPSLVGFLADGCAQIDQNVSTVVGLRLRTGRDSFPRYAIELWSPVANDVGDCVTTTWNHWVAPRVKADGLTGWSFEDGPLMFGMEANARPAPATWKAGPYLPAPGSVYALVAANDYMVHSFTTVEPPEVTDGRVYLAVDTAANTDVAATTPIRTTGPAAAKPGSPDTGDEFQLNTVNHVARWSGAAWIAITPLTSNLAVTA